MVNKNTSEAAKILKSIFKDQTEGEPCTIKACKQALVKFDLDLKKVQALEIGIMDADAEAEYQWIDIRWFITHVSDGNDPSTYVSYSDKGPKNKKK